MLETFDRIETRLAGNSSTLELSSAAPETAPQTETFRVTPQVDFLAFAVFDSEGRLLDTAQGVQVQLREPGGGWLEAADTPQQFVERRQYGIALAIINDPHPGEWELKVHNTIGQDLSLGLYLHGSLNPASSQRIAPFGSWFNRCNICKLSVKTLAVMILSVAAKAAIPVAVTAAVAKFLGVAKAFALPFIKGMAGLSFTSIAERLCQKVRFCP